MIVRKFIDALKVLSLNLTMGETEIRYLSMRTELHNLQIKPIFCFCIFLLGCIIYIVHVRCEFIDNWLRNNKQCLDFFVQFEKLKRLNIYVVPKFQVFI